MFFWELVIMVTMDNMDRIKNFPESQYQHCVIDRTIFVMPIQVVIDEVY